MRWSLPLALALFVPAVASAQAPSEDAIRQGGELFDQGTLAFERGDYGEAADAFQRAYELTHHPDLLYNVYSAQERNGQLEVAATALEGYLRDGSPEAARRGALELRLARLRERIATQRAEAAERLAAASRERAEAA